MIAISMPHMATDTIETNAKLSASRRAMTRFGASGAWSSSLLEVSVICIGQRSIRERLAS
jgi:hypothetical protein